MKVVFMMGSLWGFGIEALVVVSRSLVVVSRFDSTWRSMQMKIKYLASWV